MKEDIKILEEFIKTGYHTLMLKYEGDRHKTNKKIEHAIENLIARYKELVNEKEEMAKFIEEQELKLDLSIPKSKVKEKIEEIENRFFTYNMLFTDEQLIEDEIQILQDLLEES